MRQLNGMGSVFRANPLQGQDGGGAQVPDPWMNLCKINSGLISGHGQTGSGKFHHARGDDR